MKQRCEKCAAPTGPADAAYICSFECTFCPDCVAAMAQVCPNCGGNLVLRPLRSKSPARAFIDRVRARISGAASQ
ncbi:MAG: DUF1272 domain-containing protein [Gammaproteobacteria bacterium]